MCLVIFTMFNDNILIKYKNRYLLLCVRESLGWSI